MFDNIRLFENDNGFTNGYFNPERVMYCWNFETGQSAVIYFNSLESVDIKQRMF